MSMQFKKAQKVAGKYLRLGNRSAPVAQWQNVRLRY